MYLFRGLFFFLSQPLHPDHCAPLHDVRVIEAQEELQTSFEEGPSP